MKEYLEQQLKKKAHELVMIIYRVASRVRGQKGPIFSLRQNVSRIPITVFEAQDRQFDEDKIKYLSAARNYLFEVRYYTDLLYSTKSITYYSYRLITAKVNLLDKLIASRINSIDRQRAKQQHKIAIREKYI